MLRQLGVDAVAGAAAQGPRGRLRPDPARRREHDDAQAHRRVGPAPADPRPGRQGRADLRHVRRHDPAQQGDHATATRRSSRCSTSRSSATPSAVSWKASKRSSTCPSWATGRCTPCSSARRSSSASGPDVDVHRAARRRPRRRRARRARSSPPPSTPSWPARRASTASWRRWPPHLPSPARVQAGGRTHSGAQSGATTRVDKVDRDAPIASGRTVAFGWPG